MMFFIKTFAMLLHLIALISRATPMEAKSRNRLENQHFRVIWARRGGEYNSSYVGPKKGGLMVEYLAARFKFSVSFLTVKEVYMYPVGAAKRGLVNYLLDGECDLLVHDVLMNPTNYKQMDLTFPWLGSSIHFLVPVPDTMANINAVAKPFQWPVWVAMVFSLIITIFTLKLTYRSPSLNSWREKRINRVRRPLKRKLTTENLWGRHGNEDDIKSLIRTQVLVVNTWNPYLYVFGMLLSQGGPCILKNLSSRIIAGVWCVTTFVLVQAYTSTLFTYVVTPSVAPLLANSVYDVVNKPEITLVVEAGQNIENAIKSTQETTGVFKQLRDKLEAFPNMRCFKASHCVEMVKKGPNIVLGHSYYYMLDSMLADFKRTGKCELQMAKENFWPYQVSWGLPKGSPNTEGFSVGIQEIWQYGLMDLWENWFRPIPGQCLGKIKQQKAAPKSVKTYPLGMRNLWGAFIALLSGYCFSVLIFAIELIRFAMIRHGKRERRPTSTPSSGMQETNQIPSANI